MSSTISDPKVLDASYIQECSQVMANALVDSPSYKYFVRGSMEDRIKTLEWIFEKNINLTLDKYPSALRGMTNADGQVVVCFMWIPTFNTQIPMWDMVMVGLWKIPFLFGWDTMKRLLNLIEKEDGAMLASFEGTTSDDVAKLHRMSVRSDCQGMGLGSRAMKALREENPTAEVRISTQEDRTVRFYERLGFKVVDEHDFFPEDPVYGFHSWNLSWEGKKKTKA